MAALITGRVGEGWLLETRRWALFAWGFLTIGILLGGWWSYEVLGWSGVWAWDPVENASLMPWLTATAYIHSVLVQQRRGMLRVWNLSLLIATFALTILGTFLTRSGVIGSVHAFSAGEVDGYLLGFLALVVVVSLVMIAWRGDRLRSPGVIDSPRLAGGRLPRQQRRVRGVRLRRPARHGLPADRRGARRPPHRGRRAVLRSAVDADRHRPAVPDGGGAGAAVAQGLAGAVARALVLAGVVRCAGAGRGGRCRCRRMGAAGRVRPGRVRRRVGAAPTGAGHTTSGLAGPDGARQRRHDRAPRRDRDRRRAGGVERLHEVGRDHACAPASRSTGRATRSSSSTSPPSRPTAPTSCAPTCCSTAARSTGRRSRPTSGWASPIGTPSVRAGLTGDVYLTIAGNRPPEVGRRRGAPRGVPQAAHHLALDRWADDGGRHGAGGVPGNRRRRPIDPGVGSGARRLRTRRSPLADLQTRIDKGVTTWSGSNPSRAPVARAGSRRGSSAGWRSCSCRAVRRAAHRRQGPPGVGRLAADRQRRPRLRGRARRRVAVRTVAPQGQLGGAQLLHPQLRAVHPRAPRADRVRQAAARARQRRRRALHDRPRQHARPGRRVLRRARR